MQDPGTLIVLPSLRTGRRLVPVRVDFRVVFWVSRGGYSPYTEGRLGWE